MLTTVGKSSNVEKYDVNNSWEEEQCRETLTTDGKSGNAEKHRC